LFRYEHRWSFAEDWIERGRLVDGRCRVDQLLVHSRGIVWELHLDALGNRPTCGTLVSKVPLQIRESRDIEAVLVL
jgi:hypothetical protein